jgi:hypothetical protein
LSPRETFSGSLLFIRADEITRHKFMMILRPKSPTAGAGSLSGKRAGGFGRRFLPLEWAR